MGEHLDRIPPHDLDAEEATLGSCLIDAEALLKITDIVEPNDFHRDKNRWVMEALLACFQRREAINQITVASELSRVGRIESIGGTAYLSNLIMNVPTAIHVEYYARIVKRLSVMRSLIVAGGIISDIGYEAPPDEIEATTRAVSTILRYTKNGNSDGCRQISEIAQESYEQVFDMLSGNKIMPGVSTGFKRLDYAIDGWQKGLFTVIAARPGIGKTQTILASARKCATKDSVAVIFSLETPKSRLVTRLAYMEAGINEIQLRRDLRDNKLTAEERDEITVKINDAYATINDLDIMIEDGRMSTVQLEAKIRRLQAEYPIGVVFIDHLGKLTDCYDSIRYQKISSISNRLSSMTLACNIPIVALCQLSRDVESKDRKGDRKPRMSDLRDSGVVEEDARIILGLYRESYYDENAYPPDLMECIVLKYNEGESFQVIPLKYDKTTRRISDWPRDREYMVRKEEEAKQISY